MGVLYNQGGSPSADRIEYEFWCCTQAMIFRESDHLDEMMTYIDNMFDESPIDWLIRDWTKEHVHETGVYLKVPNLFQHTGVVSSLAEKASHPIHTSMTWRIDPSNARDQIVKVNYQSVVK